MVQENRAARIGNARGVDMRALRVVTARLTNMTIAEPSESTCLHARTTMVALGPGAPHYREDRIPIAKQFTHPSAELRFFQSFLRR